MFRIREKVNRQLILKKVSRNVVHAAHSYYNFKNKPFSQVEFVIMLSSAVFFKVFNPNSTIDFYGDKKTAQFVMKTVGHLNIYDNIDGHLLDDFLSKNDISTNHFFAFSKFVAIKDLWARYEEPVCILDIDMIAFKNLADLIHENKVICTHYEQTEYKRIYPDLENIHHPSTYKFPSEAYKFKGLACNTSVLGIADKEILDTYTSEVFRFMNHNNTATYIDQIWVEQVLLPIICKKFSVKVYSLLDTVYSPRKIIFQPPTWCFYYVCTLVNNNNNCVYHTWISKNWFNNNPVFAEYTCLLILKYMEIIASKSLVGKLLKISIINNLEDKYNRYSKNKVEFMYKIIVAFDSFKASTSRIIKKIKTDVVGRFIKRIPE